MTQYERPKDGAAPRPEANGHANGGTKRRYDDENGHGGGAKRARVGASSTDDVEAFKREHEIVVLVRTFLWLSKIKLMANVAAG